MVPVDLRTVREYVCFRSYLLTVVDVVEYVKSDGTEWLATWLQARNFGLEGVNADGIGHRFVRNASGGPGRTIVDVLAPEGLSDRTNTYTVRPARTVQAPGTVQAFRRSDVVEVTVSGITGRGERSGVVRCPDLLGALIAKAAATKIPVRSNPERDWQDAALLLATIPDPISASEACDKKGPSTSSIALAALEPRSRRLGEPRRGVLPARYRHPRLPS